MGTTAQAEDMFAANNVLKSIADSIKATSDIIDGLTVILPDLTRSIVVEVDNMTSRKLTRTDRTIFQTGGFGPTLPQGHIVPLRSDAFTFASRFGEGVDGMVTYAIEEVGEFSVAADNPIVGNASVNVFSNATVDGFISIIGSHSGGNHNHARFAVIEKGLQAQSDWRFCRKCHSMFFDGFPGKGLCGAGGGHEASGFVFTLPHSFTASREHFQSDWRFCRKCQSMFFDGFPEKGPCAGGGGHEASGFVFTLPHDIPASSHAQDKWRFCRKCQAMFFDGFDAKGVCKGGGGHLSDGFVFVLNHHG